MLVTIKVFRAVWDLASLVIWVLGHISIKILGLSMIRVIQGL